MAEFVLALVVAGVGVLLLVLLLAAALRSARRFGRAAAALRSGWDDRMRVVRALVNARHR